ncbi:MAG: aminopeptidase N [Pseudomonadota bacterium]
MTAAAQDPKTVYLKDYRTPDYAVDAVSLDFDLDTERTRVRTRLQIRRTPNAATDAPLVLNGEEIELARVNVDGKRLQETAYVVDGKTLTLPSLPEHFVLEIENYCAPAKNTALSGLYASSDMLCTQCEAEGFRRITYFPDRPDILAKYSVRMTANKNKFPVLLSNGNPVGAGETGDGRHWAAWEDPHPKPSYLFALVAGDLARVEDNFTTMSGRNVALHIYVQYKDIKKCDYALDALKRAMRWDEEVYGREYDLDVFQIVAVDHFNMGAMENKGLNIFNAAYVLASPETATDTDYEYIESIVAHEYFHNWSGNRVTCRDWFQLCLKEGFTVFRDQQFSADMRSGPVQRIKDVKALRARQFPEDAGPLAHPVRPESFITIDNFYTATVYEKGAELVRMMCTLIGPEAFRAATDLYFDRHDGEAATVEDFVAAMEAASGKDLTQFRLWYVQAGTPVARLEDDYDAKKGVYTLTVTQSTPPTPKQADKKPLHMPLRAALVFETGAPGREHMLELTSPSETFTFENVPARPVLSAFRSLSAPVVVKRDLPLADRLLLMRRDDDLYNRWETAHRLLLDVVLTFAGDARLDKAEQALSAYADALGDLLENETDDAFAAEALKTPSQNDVAQEMEIIDPAAIAAALAKTERGLADRLAEPLTALGARLCDTSPYRPDAASAGRRAMKNAALKLRLSGADPDAGATALAQFRDADNMTDAAGAVSALALSDRPERAAALSEFYDAWRGEPLVVNKWLSWQAMAPRADTFQTVQDLLTHDAFAMNNPNKVRALIGAFAMHNLSAFHCADGAAYVFFADQVLKLDKMNPQLAARLVGALENWRRFDSQRQVKTKAELKRILQTDGLSENLFEMANRLLEGA